jgi:hypothetical protein
MILQRQGTSVRLDECVFAVLQAAAVEGRRCPSNGEIAMQVRERGIARIATTTVPGVLQRLVRDGAITIRYFSRHSRQVVLHEGPYAGKATAPPDNKSEPVEVIDAEERKRRDEAPRR